MSATYHIGKEVFRDIVCMAYEMDNAHRIRSSILPTLKNLDKLDIFIHSGPVIENQPAASTYEYGICLLKYTENLYNTPDSDYYYYMIDLYKTTYDPNTYKLATIAYCPYECYTKITHTFNCGDKTPNKDLILKWIENNTFDLIQQHKFCCILQSYFVNKK